MEKLKGESVFFSVSRLLSFYCCPFPISVFFLFYMAWRSEINVKYVAKNISH